MSDQPDLVLNIEPISHSTLVAMDLHETARKPDGASHIDPARRHLNRLLCGPPSPLEAVKAFRASGVGEPTVRTEAPYVRLLISASPEYFRPNAPEAVGTFDVDRLAAFETRMMDWLRQTFGDDLVHVALHADEDTPHYHVLVVPTYSKKRRKPGKIAKGETQAEFSARLQAWADSPCLRTMSRSKNLVFAELGSFEKLRRGLHGAVADLGLSYGDDLAGRAAHQTTRAWVKEQAAALADKIAAVEVERAALVAQAESVLDDAHRDAQVIVSAASHVAQTVIMAAETEAAELRLEIEAMRAEAKSLFGQMREFLLSIKSLLAEAEAEAMLLRRAKLAFGSGKDLLAKLRPLREALKRTAEGYPSGQLGTALRDMDQPVLTAYRATEAPVPVSEEPRQIRPKIATPRP